MMPDECCELTELPVEMCSHCRLDRTMERVVDQMTRPLPPEGSWRDRHGSGGYKTGGNWRQRFETPVEATRRMPCPVCDTWIEVGGQILYDTATQVWRHASCI